MFFTRLCQGSGENPTCPRITVGGPLRPSGGHAGRMLFSREREGRSGGQSPRIRFPPAVPWAAMFHGERNDDPLERLRVHRVAHTLAFERRCRGPVPSSSGVRAPCAVLLRVRFSRVLSPSRCASRLWVRHRIPEAGYQAPGAACPDSLTPPVTKKRLEDGPRPLENGKIPKAGSRAQPIRTIEYLYLQSQHLPTGPRPEKRCGPR
jgi:hypothetical protein